MKADNTSGGNGGNGNNNENKKENKWVQGYDRVMANKIDKYPLASLKQKIESAPKSSGGFFGMLSGQPKEVISRIISYYDIHIYIKS
jgi:hypothetical protein